MSVYMDQIATGRYRSFIDFTVFSLSFSTETSESAILMPIKPTLKHLLAAYSINGLIVLFVIRALH